jgi:hypothetical protein
MRREVKCPGPRSGYGCRWRILETSWRTPGAAYHHRIACLGLRRLTYWPRGLWNCSAPRRRGRGPHAVWLGVLGERRGLSGCCSRWSLSGGGSERWKAGYPRTGEDVAATHQVQAEPTEFCRARPCCAADLPCLCPTVAPSSPNSKVGQAIESFQIVAGLPDCPTTFCLVHPKSDFWCSNFLQLAGHAGQKMGFGPIPGKVVGQWGSQ